MRDTLRTGQPATISFALSRFRGLKTLCEGVFFSRDLLTGRDVLVKRFEAAAMQTEAALSLTLTDHPAFRAVRSVERHGGQLTLAMDHLEGAFLHENT